MVTDKTNLFFERYLFTKEKESKKIYSENVKLVVCLLLYLVIVFIQIRTRADGNLNGIVAQLLVFISIFMVISVKKKGYVLAVIINIYTSFSVGVRVFIVGEIQAAPGVFIPICTIIVITILSQAIKELNFKFSEVKEQKEELVALYEELVSTQEELSEQNTQLLEYNREMKDNEEKLNYLAFYDIITELPNRKMIINTLDQLTNLTIPKRKGFTLVFIDLDNFKRINDTMGHYSGDLLLKLVASRLTAVINKEDSLGRLGGDEFALIIKRQLMEEEISDYVELLKQELSKVYVVDRTELKISASFGISMYPQDGLNSTELLKSADTAMYKVKESGKNGVRFFSKEMKEEILKRFEFESRLLSALQNEELYLMYQPQYYSDTKDLRGFEALIRWQSKEYGLVNPTQFIPVAEETKYILPMGEWVLRKSCETQKHIYDLFQLNLIISVNISIEQIMDQNFVRNVKNILNDTGVNGEFLEFEITESILISSMEYVTGVLNELKELGIRIALDDFGIGYSSLGYLQMLPIDTMKIDKTFIDNIDKRIPQKQIVGSIISLVHQMDILVVAEGVENHNQLDYLKGHHCDLIQGFLWGKPLNYRELDKLVGANCNSILV